jgi:uncharacterized protein YjbI with pentapeptide repeats
MDKKEIDKILINHNKWLNSEDAGVYANLRDADLRYADLRCADLLNTNLQDADLRYANLLNTNLQDADLRYADLRYANLQGADLQGANLRYANLDGANLDFSCFPLWCGSFDMKVDDRLVKQLLGHIARLNIDSCSNDIKKFVKGIPKKFSNDLCKRHSSVEEI